MSTLTVPTPSGVALDNLALLDETLRERLIGRIEKTESGMTRELAERILDQAIGYLQLAALMPGERFTPSPLVDIGWHAFLLYTRDYTAFCSRLTGGGYIHHEPHDNPLVTPVSTRPVRTMLAMRQAGITVDEALWAGCAYCDCDDGSECSRYDASRGDCDCD